MKTITKAAVLLLSAILLPQASLAGKPSGPCSYIASNPATACTSEISDASTRLTEAQNAFSSKRGEQDYNGLTCKIAAAEDKMGQDKPEDAYYKLADSALKVETLLNQGKLEIGDDEYEMLKSALDDAASCAYDEAFN